MSSDQNSSTQFENDEEFEELSRAVDDASFLVVAGSESSYSEQFEQPFDPELIDGFEIIGRAGKGGTSDVYHAKRNEDGKEFAVKVLRQTGDSNGLRFRREVASLKKLQHKNIATLYDVGQSSSGQLYLVLEFVNGVRIDQYCIEHELTLEQKLILFQSVCDAVEHAHQNEVLHRDLKPSNVLVDRQGIAKLTDFGLAKDYAAAASTEQTRTGAVLGTLNFLASEQLFASKSRISERTDVFGLGGILHVLLTGEPPLNFTNLVDAATKYFRGLPTKLSTETIPKSLESICLKCLAADPGDRYPTVVALKTDIARFLSGQRVQAKGANLRTRWALFRKQYPGLATAIPVSVLLLLTLTSVMFFLWRNSQANYELAERRNEILATTLDSLSDEIRSKADDPKTIDERIALLLILNDSYQKLNEDGRLQNPSIAFAVAKTEHVLGRAYHVLGEAKLAKEFAEKSQASFAELVKRFPDEEERVFGLFHSYLALENPHAALPLIEQLLRTNDTNNDYIDAACHTHHMLASDYILNRKFDLAEKHFVKARQLLDRLPMEAEFDLDGRFRLKQADNFEIKARLAIISGDLAEAQRCTQKSLETLREVDVFNAKSPGLGCRLLNFYTLAISVAALQKNREQIDSLAKRATKDYNDLDKNFSDYSPLYDHRIRTLQQLASFYDTHQEVEKLDDTISQMKRLLQNWKIKHGNHRAFLISNLTFLISPHTNSFDKDAVADCLKILNEDWPEFFLFEQGIARLQTGDLKGAIKAFNQLLEDRPACTEAKIFLANLQGDESSFKEFVNKARQIRLELAGVRMAYKESLVFECIESSLKRQKELN